MDRRTSEHGCREFAGEPAAAHRKETMICDYAELFTMKLRARADHFFYLCLIPLLAVCSACKPRVTASGSAYHTKSGITYCCDIVNRNYSLAPVVLVSKIGGKGADY